MSGYRQALAFIQRPDIEGGESNHPDDPGGLTLVGVTQGAYNDFRVRKGLSKRRVTECTPEEREQLYFEDYWLAGKCDGLPYPLSLVHFDSMVQHAKAPSLLQRALGVKEDGIIGPLTLNAAVTENAVRHAEDLIWVRVLYYRDLRNWRSMGRGWMARMAALRKAVVG